MYPAATAAYHKESSLWQLAQAKGLLSGVLREVTAYCIYHRSHLGITRRTGSDIMLMLNSALQVFDHFEGLLRIGCDCIRIVDEHFSLHDAVCTWGARP